MFKKKKVNSDKRLVLEYLIVFQKSGLPIFSKCFGDFCGALLVDDALLSGFLSAMTSMPSVFGRNEAHLNAIEMGFTKLLFSHTLPSGHVICLGFNKNTIDKNNQKKVDELFDKINTFIETDNKNINWSFLSSEEIAPIVEQLLNNIVTPWVHVSADYTKDHISGCPMCIEGPVFRGDNDIGIKQPIWKRLNDIYEYGRKIFKDDLPRQKQMLKDKGVLE